MNRCSSKKSNLIKLAINNHERVISLNNIRIDPQMKEWYFRQRFNVAIIKKWIKTFKIDKVNTLEEKILKSKRTMQVLRKTKTEKDIVFSDVEIQVINNLNLNTIKKMVDDPYDDFSGEFNFAMEIWDIIHLLDGKEELWKI